MMTKFSSISISCILFSWIGFAPLKASDFWEIECPNYPHKYCQITFQKHHPIREIKKCLELHYRQGINNVTLRTSKPLKRNSYEVLEILKKYSENFDYLYVITPTHRLQYLKDKTISLETTPQSRLYVFGYPCAWVTSCNDEPCKKHKKSSGLEPELYDTYLRAHEYRICDVLSSRIILSVEGAVIIAHTLKKKADHTDLLFKSKL